MDEILKALFNSGATTSAAPNPIWFWVKLAVGIVVVLTIFRLVFVFSVKQQSVGFMQLGEKLVRENLKPGWYLCCPFIYHGKAVYLGLRTLKFEEQIPTLDQAMLDVSGAYQYRVSGEKAALFFFGVEDPDTVIKERLLSAARSAVSSKESKDILEHKDTVALAIREIVDTGLLEDVGVKTADIPLTVAPHKDVAAAFNAVQVAQRRKQEAVALAEVKLTEARADATATGIRAGGQQGQLARQAEGLLEMFLVLTGKLDISLPPEAAMFLITNFLGLQMRTAFAANGNNTAMIIPDDGDMLKEMVSLLPTLVAHSGVEGNEKDADEMAVFERKANAAPELTKAAAKEFADAVKSGTFDDAIVEKLPSFLRPWGRRVIAAQRRKADYGAK